MIKAVVFDLDHTLFDRYATIKEAVPLIKDKFEFAINGKITNEQLAEYIIEADKACNHYGFGAVAKYLYDKGYFKLLLTKEEYRDIVYSGFSQVAVPYDFTKTVLLKIREMGYKVALITNGRHYLQYSKLENMGITHMFDEIIVCGDVGISKPEAKPFEVMAEKLGFKPCEMLYVGDHPKNDVMGSRQAGYIPVWVKTVDLWDFPEIEKCELQVDSVKEIPDLLNKIQKTGL